VSKGECVLAAVFESVTGLDAHKNQDKFRSWARSHPNFENWDEQLKLRLNDEH